MIEKLSPVSRMQLVMLRINNSQVGAPLLSEGDQQNPKSPYSMGLGLLQVLVPGNHSLTSCSAPERWKKWLD